jgi:hypothetical protein
MIEKLGEDHLTEDERLRLAEKWGRKKPSPKAMTTEEQLREKFKQRILQKPKKK